MPPVGQYLLPAAWEQIEIKIIVVPAFSYAAQRSALKEAPAAAQQRLKHGGTVHRLDGQKATGSPRHDD